MMAVTLTALFFLVAAFEVGLIDAARWDYKDITASTRAWYKYHEQRATWHDAQATCRSEGAVLFHPDSEAELREVKAGLSVRFTLLLHSGFSDLKKPGHYETVDGCPLEQVFNTWIVGYEEAWRYGLRCGTFQFYRPRLAIGDCFFTRPFICKTTWSVTALGNAQHTIANLAAKIADLERELANRTAVLEAVKEEAQAMKIQDGNQIAVLKVLTTNQTAALQSLERDVEAIKLYVATQQQHQTHGNGLEVVTEAVTNQAANLTTAM